MATIGILGGMGPQASNKLCELIISKALDQSVNREDTDVPEIILLSVPVPNFVSNKDNMKIAKNMLIKRVRLFDNADCDIAGIACNTAHLLLPEIKKHTKVPFVSLPHLVAERLTSLSAKRVGLLATPTTLKSRLYDDALSGVQIIRPSKRLVDLTEINIKKKLQDILTLKEEIAFTDEVLNFLEENELDAVVLGCTELPLVFSGSKDDRIIDTLDILSNALLEKCSMIRSKL
jgi:aspartate racemase